MYIPDCSDCASKHKYIKLLITSNLLSNDRYSAVIVAVNEVISLMTRVYCMMMYDVYI